MPYKKGTKHSEKGTTKLVCKECSSIYFRTLSSSKNSKYCSRKCKDLNTGKKEKHPRWSGGNVKLPCTLCKSLVERGKSRIRKHKNIFCSCRCRMLFYRSLQKTKKTDIEIIVENILIKNNVNFYAQKRISNICIADFFIPKMNIAIFCDGDYWHNFPVGKPRDVWQIEQLHNIGIIGLRFWGSEINKNDFEINLLNILSSYQKPLA